MPQSDERVKSLIDPVSFEGNHVISGAASLVGLMREAPNLTVISRVASDLVNLMAWQYELLEM